MNTVSTVGVDFVDEPPCGVDHTRISTECLDEWFDLFEAVEQLGVFLRKSEELLSLGFLFGLDLADGAGLESFVTPHTERLAPRRFLPAAIAFDGGDRVGFVFLDVKAMGAGEFAIACLGKDRDVPCGGVTSGRPSMMVLENGLVDSLVREIGCRRLSKVGERDRLGDFGALGGLAWDFPGHLVRHLVTALELAPQRRAGVVAARVRLEPLTQVRPGSEQRDRALAGLAVDGDLHTVFVVGDVADAKTEEFTGASTRVPRGGDESGVSRVQRCIDHREDVILPVKHFDRVRHRVVAPTRPGRDPRECDGNAVVVRLEGIISLGDPLAEHAEGDAVIPLGLLIIVGPLDPADQVLGDRTVLEGVSEGDVREFVRPLLLVALSGEDFAVTDQLLATINRVLVQSEAVVELTEAFAITVVDGVGFLDLLAREVEAPSGVLRHGVRLPYSKEWELNLGFVAWLRRFR